MNTATNYKAFKITPTFLSNDIVLLLEFLITPTPFIVGGREMIYLQYIIIMYSTYTVRRWVSIIAIQQQIARKADMLLYNSILWP